MSLCVKVRSIYVSSAFDFLLLFVDSSWLYAFCCPPQAQQTTSSPRLLPPQVGITNPVHTGHSLVCYRVQTPSDPGQLKYAACSHLEGAFVHAYTCLEEQAIVVTPENLADGFFVLEVWGRQRPPHVDVGDDLPRLLGVGHLALPVPTPLFRPMVLVDPMTGVSQGNLHTALEDGIVSVPGEEEKQVNSPPPSPSLTLTFIVPAGHLVATVAHV